MCIVSAGVHISILRRKRQPGFLPDEKTVTVFPYPKAFAGHFPLNYRNNTVSANPCLNVRDPKTFQDLRDLSAGDRRIFLLKNTVAIRKAPDYVCQFERALYSFLKGI